MRGVKNEKKVISFYCVICIIIVFSVVFTGCATNRNINTDISDIIEGNSHTTGRLEATIEALDGTVIDSRKRVEDIIKTSRSIADGIERIEYLFTEYERETNRLLNEIDRIRNEAKIQGEADKNSDNTDIDIYSGENRPADT